MKKMIKYYTRVILLLSLMALTLAGTGCQLQETSELAVSADFGGKTMTLVTTTSTENSGLLDAILPEFKKTFNCDIKVIAVGSGAAFEMAEQGEADVILVHAPKSEDAFMSEGFGRVRKPLMYNDYVLVGSESLEALALKDATDIVGALKAIATQEKTFVSRGDDSGTHKKELQLWEKAAVVPSGDYYLSVGKGMGEVLTMASELGAFTLTDRATYLSMKDQMDLDVIIEGNDLLNNPYAVISISKEKYPDLQHEMADAFIAWLFEEKTLKSIESFGVDDFGQPLFYRFKD